MLNAATRYQSGHCTTQCQSWFLIASMASNQPQSPTGWNLAAPKLLRLNAPILAPLPLACSYTTNALNGCQSMKFGLQDAMCEAQFKVALHRCPLGNKLTGNSQTGHWGYWYDQLEPALVIANGSVVDVEMPTFEAGSACKQSVVSTLMMPNL